MKNDIQTRLYDLYMCRAKYLKRLATIDEAIAELMIGHQPPPLKYPDKDTELKGIEGNSNL